MVPQTVQSSLPGTGAIDEFVKTRPVLAILALCALGVLILWPYRHFSGDDAYITFRFARNFAEGHGFSFNPDVPVYGSTAPLWVFLIAGLHSLSGLDVRDSAHAFNWLFLLVNVVLFFNLAALYVGRSGAALVATVLMVADPWFVRWSLSGMENGLALCLLMSLLYSQQRWRNTGRVNWLAPLAAGLAGLCRPEMNLLAPLLVADIFLFERRRRTVNIGVAIIVCSAIILPWLWYAQAHFGSIIPTTIKAKISSQHGLALIRTGLYFLTFWPLQALAVALVAVLVIRRAIVLPAAADMRAAWFLIVAWALLLPAFYIIGGAPVAGRYMMFGLPCYLIVGVKAWTWLSPKYPRLVLASLLSTLVLVAVVQYKYCWYVTRWPQGMDAKMIKLAETLKRESAPSDVVAGDQIGVLGYFSDRYVLDTYGLASPEILAHRKSLTDQAPLWRYVLERRPQFLFVSDTSEILSQWDPAYKSLSLVEKEDVQREGAGAVGALITYYLYRTNWH